MSDTEWRLTRRRLLQGMLALSAGVALPGKTEGHRVSKRPIPATEELIPILGMGTWLTFDVGNYPNLIAQRAQVLKAFLAGGGGMVDSSPMYGSSEQTVGACLELLDDHAELFTATKVWTPYRWLGIQQMEGSMKLWGVTRFDLMQIHNMVDWETHLETLLEWKEEGRVRYIGITTSHGRRHRELAAALRRGQFDFVQFTYNLLDREAESLLLPLAADLGLAVIINRPFRRGGLFNKVEGIAPPEWASEIGCVSWAQYFLKFILSHPAVTCAIPATTRVDHMRENLQAGMGELPDQGLRQDMVDYVERHLT